MHESNSVPIVRIKLPCTDEDQFRQQFATKLGKKIFIATPMPVSQGTDIHLRVLFKDGKVRISGTATVIAHGTQRQREGMFARLVDLDPQGIQFALSGPTRQSRPNIDLSTSSEFESLGDGAEDFRGDRDTVEQTRNIRSSAPALSRNRLLSSELSTIPATGPATTPAGPATTPTGPATIPATAPGMLAAGFEPGDEGAMEVTVPGSARARNHLPEAVQAARGTPLSLARDLSQPDSMDVTIPQRLLPLPPPRYASTAPGLRMDYTGPAALVADADLHTEQPGPMGSATDVAQLVSQSEGTALPNFEMTPGPYQDSIDAPPPDQRRQQGRARVAGAPKTAATTLVLRSLSAPDWRLAAIVLAAVIAVMVHLIKPGVSSSQDDSIRDILAQADASIAAGRLVGPGGDQALDHLMVAKRRAPDHQGVRQRLHALADKFEELAGLALAENNLAEAAAHLQSALNAAPERTRLADQMHAIEARIREQMRAQPRRGGAARPRPAVIRQ